MTVLKFREKLEFICELIFERNKRELTEIFHKIT